jgi:hypothetical protein
VKILEELHSHIDINSDKPHNIKKFVFQVYDDNIDYVENLSFQDKNDLINTLISNYIVESSESKASKKQFKSIKKSVFIILALIIGIPLIIYMAAVSLHMTKESYLYMQHNFEKLF